MLSSPLRSHWFRLSDSPWLPAMALVAVGMFIGYWVIAPAISTDSGASRDPLRSAGSERQAIIEAASQPDPFPYRTPTPVFDMPNAPSYAAAAKQRAQAMIGGRGSDGVRSGDGEMAFEGVIDDPPEQAPAPQRSRAWSYDRHTGVRY
jgi:hypothetical protein